MCGIAGWVDFGRNMNDEEGVMRAMCGTLAPRGPDSEGVYADTHCALAHRRLAVVDIENGRQPMTKKMHGETYTIVYNGELYNTRIIQLELERLGHSFAGHSDTEVVLSAYIEWGEKCLDRFNGIFAFGVWREKKQTLFLARDRIGVKPLFFSRYNGGIVFGSEIKTLLANPMVKRVVELEGVSSVVLLGPARKGGMGVFRDVGELLPAECAEFGKGYFRKNVYWRLHAEPHTETPEETAEHVMQLLEDSVKRQLVSDVPLCTFLSGGLDSSLISAIAAEEYRKKGMTLSTYSVDYKDNRKNFVASRFQPDEDAPWIVKMSEHIKSLHTNVELDSPQLAEALFNSTLVRDLPGMADVDSSLYLFCKEVRKNFTVAVSGECADELFGGYPWYRDDSVLFSEGFPWSRATNERYSLLRSDIAEKIDPAEYVSAACRSTVEKTEYLDSDTPRDRRTREMFMLNFHWFMQTLLDRKDRCSMASGLEVRVPFCDYRLAQYAYNIPADIKDYGGREKGIVRLAAERYLPKDVVWRKKSPYPKTHNPEYLRIVTEMLTNVAADSSARIFDIFDREKIMALIENRGSNFGANWYGQLMTAPQMLAYLLQTEYWLREYGAEFNL